MCFHRRDGVSSSPNFADCMAMLRVTLLMKAVTFEQGRSGTSTWRRHRERRQPQLRPMSRTKVYDAERIGVEVEYGVGDGGYSYTKYGELAIVPTFSSWIRRARFVVDLSRINLPMPSP